MIRLLAMCAPIKNDLISKMLALRFAGRLVRRLARADSLQGGVTRLPLNDLPGTSGVH